MKIGLIGSGNIARVVAENAEGYEIECVYDAVEATGKNFAEKYGCRFLKPEDFPKLDLVVEAASQEAVSQYAELFLKKGQDLMIMSVGALVDEKLLNELKASAKTSKAKIILPSGAIAGLDGLNSANVGKIEKVSITTVKPPKSLGLTGEEAKKAKILFQGPASEAVKKFPKNINVAATLALAGIGFEKTRVKIVSDPKVDKNQHEIYIKGDFGEICIQVYNEPSPDNPKTSYLAAMSAVAAIKRFKGNLIIG